MSKNKGLGLVSALASVEVLMMVAVLLADSAALRAALRSVLRRDFQYFGAVLVCLVSQELLKLIESP